MAKSLPLWILTEDSRTKSNQFRVHHSHDKVFTEQFVTPSSRSWRGPFGTDPNDLPLETIRKSVTEILGDAAAGAFRRPVG